MTFCVPYSIPAAIGLTILLHANASGQTFSADEGKRLRPMTDGVAESLLKESFSAARLTAEGQVLHENTLFPQSWGKYCASAASLNDDGEFRLAVRAAGMALFLGQQSNNVGALAYAKRDLAVSFSYSGHLELAERYARESLGYSLNQRGREDVGMVSHKTLGDVALRRSQHESAIAEYEAALRLSASSRSWRQLVQVSLANALLAKGELDKARGLLDEVTGSVGSPILEQVRRAQANLALKEGKTAEALSLFRKLAGTGGADAAYHRVWAWEGQARAQQAAGDRSAAIDALLEAVKGAEEVRARFRSEEFKTGMFGELQEIFARAVALLIESGQAERALEIAEAGRSRALLDQIRGRVKTVRAPVFPTPAAERTSVAALRARLAPGETVVAYYVLSDKVFAWTIEPAGVRATTLPLARESLRTEITQLRRDLAERSPAVREILRQLHKELVEPLALAAARSVVFIPHDALHHLPFHALRDAEGYLIERAEVSYAPSVTLLVHLLERRAESTVPAVLALGNPDLGNPKLALPGAEREVKQIQEIFPGAKIFLGPEATKPVFLKGAPQAALVHIAAHADFDALDPLYSRIRLATSEESTGVLEAHEVYGLDLRRTSLVTLSACESGMSRVTNGDEIWGFSRSFLSAGAPALLVSQWPVADESTENLMSAFYRGLRSKSPRAALRDAQLATLRHEPFAHPFFWSPFILVGDWR